MADSELDWQEAQSEPETEGHNQRTRFLVLGTVVALALGYMIYAAFPGNALYFLTVNEFNNKAAAQDGRTVRVSGKLVVGSFQRQGSSMVSTFSIQDEAGEIVGEHLTASYEGVMPDLFFNPHTEIILEGSFGPQRVFEADAIMVKCPSKYQSLEGEAPYANPES